MNIPALIHQTWKTTDIPRIYQPDWVSSWKELHPAWRYCFWTDNDLRHLANRMFPLFGRVFDSMPGIIKADVGRLMVLATFGGLYVDLDYQALKSLDELLENGDLFLSRIRHGRRRPYVHNALMASVPGHPFLHEALESSWGRWASCPRAPVEWISGPTLITELALKYEARDRSPVYLEQNQVCPLDWAGPRKWIRRAMVDPAGSFPDAHAITYWVHNW